MINCQEFMAYRELRKDRNTKNLEVSKQGSDPRLNSNIKSHRLHCLKPPTFLIHGQNHKTVNK